MSAELSIAYRPHASNKRCRQLACFHGNAAGNDRSYRRHHRGCATRRRRGRSGHLEPATDDDADQGGSTDRSAPTTAIVEHILQAACAIAASAPAVAGLPRWLRAYRGRASARSCCRGEPLIPAHHHAFGNAFLRLPPETRRACPTAFWPHSAGSAGSGRYYADDRPSSFRLRRNGIGAASGSPIIVDLAGAQPALSRMLRGGIIR